MKWHFSVLIEAHHQHSINQSTKHLTGSIQVCAANILHILCSSKKPQLTHLEDDDVRPEYDEALKEWAVLVKVTKRNEGHQVGVIRQTIVVGQPDPTA